jgi:hypothetical protein
MKTQTRKPVLLNAARKLDPDTRERLVAARRMGRMVREENRRWGLPLIVRRDGKIVNEPA